MDIRAEEKVRHLVVYALTKFKERPERASSMPRGTSLNAWSNMPFFVALDCASKEP